MNIFRIFGLKAAEPESKAKKPTSRLKPVAVRRSLSTARQDIADWNAARRAATSPTTPRQYRLQDIYQNCTTDALLSSQIANRTEPTLAAPFELVGADGQVDDAATAALAALPIVTDIIQQIVLSEFYGYSLCEIDTTGQQPELVVLPRQNVDIVNGEYLANVNDANGIRYRELREFGRFILEFNSGHLGILNKTVPHVLFKKFAQSCWSELCEIYGIPPLVLKTNTQDPEMRDAARQMLEQLGASAKMLIDTTEELQFATSVVTNGDVYNNLIRLCNNEISLVVSGAIVGQDTVNGNYSKEQASIDILDRLIDSDRRMVEQYMNTTVLPALAAINLLPAAAASLRFRFAATEDADQLWQKVKDVLPYKDVDNKWLAEKFGLPVSDKTFGADSSQLRLLKAELDSAERDFFG